jgi:hypothetical protein
MSSHLRDVPGWSLMGNEGKTACLYMPMAAAAAALLLYRTVWRPGVI